MEISNTEVVANDIVMPNSQQDGFFRRKFLNPVGYFFSSIGSCFCSRSSQRDRDLNLSNVDNSIFERFPSYTRYSEEVGKLNS